MGQTFLHKIEGIILSKIEDENFGVSDLAAELHLSRSQVLRKVKAETGKSVNQFIRDIKLREGAKLLTIDELTASEIAYKVGFSSPSYFNKCFLDRYGVTPGEYNKKFETGEIKETEIAGQPVKWRKRSPVALLLLLAFVIVGYFIVVKQDRTTEVSEASIAVIPFLDLSANNDQEYLADGITEAMTLTLSKIKELRVPSRTSSMRFKDEKILSSEIASELNVNLILEGSVLHDGDSILVTVQLIKVTPEEEHLWAESYAKKYVNILQLVDQISREIAGNISSVIQAPAEQARNYELNRQAYDLYLRGRHLYNTQKTRSQSLQKAMEYLEESVAIDGNFAPAYVTIAETYLAINFLILDNELKLQNREKAREAINKALELDETLPEAYITKGSLAGKLDWDWEKMKAFAKEGLELDPNNSGAHILLSNYYVVNGNYKKAIDEALLAENLDPLNPMVGTCVAERYYIAGKYEQSIDKYIEVIELNPGYGLAYNGIGFAYLKAGDPEKAVDYWQKLQWIMGNEALGICYDEHPYQECFKFYLENAKNNEPRFCNNPVIISSVQMLVDDELGALEYLDIALRYKNEDLPVMLTYPDFYTLHARPEFQEIVREVGVKL